MPGLFGFARIDPIATRPEGHGRAVLEAMGCRLLHHPDYLTRTHIDPAGTFAIARTGLPGQHEVPWAEPPDSGRTFVQVAGALHIDGGLSNELSNSAEVDRALSASRGAFATVTRQPARDRVVIAVDHRSSWPVFYTEVDGYLYFAPEVKALLDVPGVDLAVDSAALGIFLGGGYLLSHQTHFARIRRLPGGHALHISGGSVEQRVYWQFRPGSRAGGDPRELRRALLDAIGAAVERHLGDPSKTMIFLSGGVDSRAILVGALRAVRGDGRALRAVSWGSDLERPGGDVIVARELARRTGLDHRTALREADRYGEEMRRTNYLIDALSDVASFHPHELVIMESLRDAGFDRVLRGDQSFGWKRSTESATGAVLEMGFRWLQDLPHVAALIAPAARASLVNAAGSALGAIAAQSKGAVLDDFKDALYFEQRLQGYLNTAAAFKQTVLDHRAPLLDREVLDVVEEIPAAGRLNKALLRAALAEHPVIGSVPYATTSNLENWGWVLDHETPLRRYAEEELADTSAGIWEYLDQSAARALLSRSTDEHALRRRSGWATLKPYLHDAALAVAPGMAARLRTRRQRQAVDRYALVLRVLALKHWHSAFVEQTTRVPASAPRR